MTRFFKVHGNGNDFIVLDNRDGSLSKEALSSAAPLWCRRKHSIGADGLLVVEKASDADFTMRIFNADGSESDMCGNGARALARYAHHTGLAGASMTFKTGAGLMKATVTPPWVELDMGRIDLSKGTFDKKLRASDREFCYSSLVVGVSHCVLLLDEDLSTEEKRLMGREIRNNEALFPGGTNVSFVLPFGENEVRAVTYERGVEDLTESCGTGSAAVALVLSTVKGYGSPIRVHNPGGVNEVRFEYEEPSGVRVWLKGKTALVVSGDILEEAMA
ncbi:MAG: diaminopimelate epimerase [Fretibacterium sp.]|nr:diaminopimelate epimerase [Fretibacterium sp.]